MRRLLIPIAVSLVLSVLASPARAVMTSVHDGVVSGRVVQTLPDGRIVGVPGLLVKLIPTTASGRAPLVSLTNGAGYYSFARQPKSAYLFEIRRGTALLYRRVLDTTRDSDFTVSLARRP